MHTTLTSYQIVYLFVRNTLLFRRLWAIFALLPLPKSTQNVYGFIFFIIGHFVTIFLHELNYLPLLIISLLLFSGYEERNQQLVRILEDHNLHHLILDIPKVRGPGVVQTNIVADGKKAS